jgi:tetratricopeptide (TPR) repeat protein
MKNVLYMLVICLFTACSEIRHIGIETYKPSEITYPNHVRKVLIVNNALPQAPDTGYEYTIAGVRQDTCRAYADSALFDACRSLGLALVEADFFDDVRLFEEGTRKDTSQTSVHTDSKLTVEEVQALCEETGTDAVISFDRLLFNTKKNIAIYPDSYYEGTIKIKAMGVARRYLPDKNEAAATVLVSDSLSWSDWGYSVKQVNNELPAPNEALRIAAQYIGTKIHTAFVPYWENENRWYYGGLGTRWKTASAYAAAEKWDEAFERWQQIYDKASGWKDKAKSASNLAFYYEINGNIEKALELATIAYQLFEKQKGEENVYTQIQKFYALALTGRIEDEKKLNLQFRAE